MAIVNVKEMSRGVEIEIPHFFKDDELITVLVKKPSILNLASKGLIPNHLLALAQDIFQKGETGANDFSQFAGLLKVMAEASLVEPSIKEIEEAGLELNDQQIACLFAFVQGGVKALERFRNKPASGANNSDGEGLQEASE